MAVTFLTGFEGQAALVDGITLTGTAQYNTSGTYLRTGAASATLTPASGASGYITVPAANYVHFGLRFSFTPTGDRLIFGSIAAGQINVRVTSSLTLAVYLNTTLIGTSSALSLSTYYWIGVRQVTGTSVAFLQIDGANAVTGTATVTATSGIIGMSGTEAVGCSIAVDDIINDDAGFLAPSKVAMLVPISTWSRDILWTGGAGGTTNLWDAVNNTPPIGTATETDLTQIEHAGGAAGTTDAYKANLTIYSTAGVGASDTVLAVQLVAAHGEDVSTGAKLLAFSMGSNPAIAATGNITVGDETPAALGTYPTEWGHHFGTLTNSPSVAIGNSPVLNVVRPETASRVASVCFMGMLVAWTPAAAGGIPFNIARRTLQAVNRASTY